MSYDHPVSKRLGDGMARAPAPVLAPKLLEHGRAHLAFTAAVQAWREVFRVPDESTHLLFALHRCTGARPDLWPNRADRVTWTLEQFVGNDWRFLGSSIAEGDVLLQPDGTHMPLSWDETSLLPGKARMVRITLTAHADPVNTVGIVLARVPP